MNPQGKQRDELQTKILRLLQTPTHRKSTQQTDYTGRGTAHSIMQAIDLYAQSRVREARLKQAQRITLGSRGDIYIENIPLDSYKA